jgi:hypothetical protein
MAVPSANSRLRRSKWADQAALSSTVIVAAKSSRGVNESDPLCHHRVSQAPGRTDNAGLPSVDRSREV